MTNTVPQVARAYRWTAPEYVLRAELHEVSEVLIEGAHDEVFFLGLLERYGLSHVDVRDATCLSVTPGEIVAAGFRSGVKGALLTVAAELCKAKGAVVRSRIAVVVDQDYDGALPERVSCVAVPTDGHSVESYALSARALERLVRIMFGRGVAGKPKDAGREALSGEALIERILPAVVALAAARMVVAGHDSRRGLFKKWADYVAIDQDGFATVDAALLVERVLAGAEVPVSLSAIEDALANARTVAAENVFLMGRGRDYIRVLYKVLSSPWGRRASGHNVTKIGEATLHRWVLAAIDLADMDEYGLPTTLRARFEAS